MKKEKYQIEMKSFSLAGNCTIWILSTNRFFVALLRPFPLKFTVFHVYLIFSFFLVLFIFPACYFYLFVFCHQILCVLNSEVVAFLVPIENNFYCTCCLCNIYCRRKSNHCGAQSTHKSPNTWTHTVQFNETQTGGFQTPSCYFQSHVGISNLWSSNF